MDGQRITEIVMESGERFQGKIFIDGTYEGDLIAAAGVDYHVGRESNDTYGETINGYQPSKNTHLHRFVVEVDPYVKPGDPGSGVLPGIHAGDDLPEEGGGDHRVQAYCFRMCMSNVPENRIPFPKPDGYDEQRYELLLRNFEAGDMRLPLKPDMMPNGKTDTNNNCAVSTDNIGMNYNYPEATYAERERIIQEHVTYQQGLMWTLANHPRVPEEIREKMSAWGLSKDEFKDTGGWGHQLYIREARRDDLRLRDDRTRLPADPDLRGLGRSRQLQHGFAQLRALHHRRWLRAERGRYPDFAGRTVRDQLSLDRPEEKPGPKPAGARRDERLAHRLRDRSGWSRFSWCSGKARRPPVCWR